LQRRSSSCLTPGTSRPGNGPVNQLKELRKIPSSRLLAEAGIDPGRPIVLYCGGDVSAAEAFGALRTAGVQTARDDDSWPEGGAGPGTPKTPHSNG
jgi:3-mercaptopyruvate sulfurtransferase SseA